MENRDNWDQHWSQLNEITELNPAQHYRHKLVFQAINDYLESRSNKIFDFGSGQGDLIRLMRSEFNEAKFTGFELGDSGVNISRIKTPDAQFVQCDLIENNPPYHKLYESGNIGVCSEVLEHLDEPKKMLITINKYLAKNAFLIITVPSGPMNEFEKSIGHRKHYMRSELENLVKSSGFSIIEIRCAGFPFFNLYKIIAFLRGKKIMQNDINPNRKISKILRIIFKIFNVLFHFNLTNSPFGWQLILIAQKQ